LAKGNGFFIPGDFDPGFSADFFVIDFFVGEGGVELAAPVNETV